MRFIVHRIGQGLLVLCLVTTATFFLINLAPGGPTSLSNFEQSEAERAAIRRQLGLDRPLPERFINWLGEAIRGDLGISFSTGVPVATMISERLPNTVLLATTALFIAIGIGIPSGVVSAVKRGSRLDRFAVVVSAIGIAIPPFWLAILSIVVFSVMFHVLPASGIDSAGGGGSMIDRLAHLVLPAATLAMGLLPAVFQYTRAAMTRTLGEDYIRAAWAKGLGWRDVYMKHALRNSLIPVVSVIGTMVPRLLGGAVVTEAVFGWPGMGRLALDAATGRDYPIVMGATVVVAMVVILTTIAVDLAYLYLDPRLRSAERR